MKTYGVNVEFRGPINICNLCRGTICLLAVGLLGNVGLEIWSRVWGMRSLAGETLGFGKKVLDDDFSRRKTYYSTIKGMPSTQDLLISYLVPS